MTICYNLKHVLNHHFKHLMLILIVCLSAIEKHLPRTKDDKTSKTPVDIILYDYTLTKVQHLRKPTVDIVKEKLPSLEGVLD